MRYEITSFRPEDLFIQIKFTDGGREFWQNFDNVQEFSDEKLAECVVYGGRNAREFWDKTPAVTTSMSEGDSGEVFELVDTPGPTDIDRFTQKVNWSWSFDGSTLTRVWTPIDLSPEEAQAFLLEWRGMASIGSTIFKQSLYKMNKAEAVEVMFIQMSDEEENLARIEWENANTFDYSSPLVQDIKRALSLTDEELDGIYKGEYWL